MNKNWLTTKQVMVFLGITLSQFRTLRRNKKLVPYRPNFQLKNELQITSLGNVLVWKRADVEALKESLKSEAMAVPVK